ncbi:glutaminase kidney isoform, mitochondrial-like [Watersipora subatra]|uniref:glutaminase kidney isoform, mitochondrial-like n=1 Tax=Watersipora subatra TaxID=2589382 RepID=UPI00355BC2C0
MRLASTMLQNCLLRSVLGGLLKLSTGLSPPVPVSHCCTFLRFAGSLRQSEAAVSLSEVFDQFSNANGEISLTDFVNTLNANGLMEGDMRLRATMNSLDNYRKAGVNTISKDEFIECTNKEFVLLKRALSNQFIIPDFEKFSGKIEDFYWQCKSIHTGKVATYIPQLSRYSPDYWAVSVCTIDGQRHSIGDDNVPFCLQSCAKPLAYSMAVNTLGSDIVHQYVGQEPSGQAFNSLVLDSSNKPHNPMINSGALIVASLLRNDLLLADRFDYFAAQSRRLAGHEYVGFHNSTFLSERATADRNYALAWFMKENKCFPEGVNMEEVLDFYFQCCSVEVTCQSAAVIAASIANGGICPTTGDRIMSSESMRNTLSLMYSCGMYDYSGQFAFKVGLPAKSGVSGCVLLVIPNVMGICLWSPPLDHLGNSVRAVKFSEMLVSKFNFHNYDNLRHTQTKADPRKRILESKINKVASMIYAAFNNDVTYLTRQNLSGLDMDQVDYDNRSALHVAASEGHLEAVIFLVEKCAVSTYQTDRWGHTPLQNALSFGHTKVADYLKQCPSL